MNAVNAIEVKNLSKSYTLHHAEGGRSIHSALADVSFTLQYGDRLGLIGKNGSGKSTLIKIISGLIKPDNGQVILNDKINSLIEVGSNFIPDLSGRENVKLFLKIQGVPLSAIPEVLEKIENFAGIGPYFDQAIKYYSSGMFIRLALAAGFHIDAKIFVLDEVLMAGDAAFRNKITQYFQHQSKQALSLILASHNPKEILNNCHRVLWLDNGRIAFLGDVQEGLEKYEEFLAKEQSEKYYFPEVKVFENTFSDFKDIPKEQLKNKYFELLDLNILPNKGKSISYEDGFKVLFSFQKKNERDIIHPLLKIYDVQMNPIVLMISSNDVYAANALNEPGKLQHQLTCHFPGSILSAGTYYLEVTAGLNPTEGERHTKEAFRLKSKLCFQVTTNTFDYTGATQHIFVKPACKWEVK